MVGINFLSNVQCSDNTFKRNIDCGSTLMLLAILENLSIATVLYVNAVFPTTRRNLFKKKQNNTEYIVCCMKSWVDFASVPPSSWTLT